ncbi:Arv1-domain-containing protein [Exidia glandulosa HHB12029]|uniref:Protein ARV n=1 Tax=Exidia glandulosa HHB12029 TaxID=1314781 RepID=A0A165QG80_EXIGL|nr:Arv1-domain-containing protein [Exidia glandulosa HHB12029]
MPICVTCATSLPHLYTVYGDKADNLRLELCPSCKVFADPYVEHDTLVVLLDLILLKVGAYRHLLFNRGSSPRREGKPTLDTPERVRSKARWVKTLKLAAPMIAVDSYIRWSQLNLISTVDIDWPTEAAALSRVVAGCILETITFHIGVTLASLFILALTDFWRSLRKEQSQTSGVRAEFRLAHVPMTLIYSSVTKLFLLFMLSIWRVPPPTSTASQPARPLYERALSVFDEDSLDRAWVVRNILGGMSAGFGLRIILDCHPVLTMLVVLAGWTVKTAMASLLGGWVAGPERSRVAETWLAYSIP